MNGNSYKTKEWACKRCRQYERLQNEIVEKEVFVIGSFLPFTAKGNILQKRSCNNLKKEKKEKESVETYVLEIIEE